MLSALALLHGLVGMMRHTAPMRPRRQAPPPVPPTRMRLIIDDEGGFTSVATAVAVLLTAALLFSASQVYWVNSHAPDVQFAADAGALAAENVVGEYVILAQVADAIVLSLGLLGICLLATGAVAACIPYVDSVAPQIIDAGRKAIKARDDFSDRAVAALNRLQAALPYVCAANAAATIEKNGEASLSGAHLIGIAIPVPLEGEELSSSHDETAGELADSIEGNHDEVTHESIEAAKAREEMNAAKLEGYLADCGESTCMYERATTLAGLSGSSNPYSQSVEGWGFEMPIERAKAYYQLRLGHERPASNDAEELTRSAARARFYRYALAQVSQNAVTVDADGTKTAHMAILPRNSDDIRQTELYTESIWPVSNEGGRLTIHGTAQCPGCSGVIGTASVAQEESGDVCSCPVCGFSAVSLGKVPAASTSIDNGFEHYYLRVAKAAQRYNEASRTYRDRTTQAKRVTSENLDMAGKALAEQSDKRITIRPPGRFGCIAVVVDPSGHDVPSALGAFVDDDTRMPPRLALSAAMLAPDEAEKGANAISSLLSGLQQDVGDGGAVGVMADACSLWGDLLLAYVNGTEGLIDDVSDFLAAVPLVGADELSGWAADQMRATLELLNIQPLDMASYKPVTVNTAHVFTADETGVGEGMLKLREGYTSLGGEGSGTLVGGFARLLGGEARDALESHYTIAHISLFDGLVERDVQVTLPDGVVARGEEAIEQFEQAADGLSALSGGMRRWE